MLWQSDIGGAVLWLAGCSVNKLTNVQWDGEDARMEGEIAWRWRTTSGRQVNYMSDLFVVPNVALPPRPCE